jgi:hypothetical protein
MIYLLGRFSSHFRKWYYNKYTKWHWGLVMFNVEISKEHLDSYDLKLTEKQLIDFWKELY